MTYVVNHSTCFKLPLVFDINISQGSVATRLRCSGIFSCRFTANISQNLTMKKVWKSV